MTILNARHARFEQTLFAFKIRGVVEWVEERSSIHALTQAASLLQEEGPQSRWGLHIRSTNSTSLSRAGLRGAEREARCLHCTAEPQQCGSARARREPKIWLERPFWNMCCYDEDPEDMDHGAILYPRPLRYLCWGVYYYCEVAVRTILVTLT